jgi:hypothetical protein
LDGATRGGFDKHHREPKAGDVSICGYCASLNVFTEDLWLREMTPAERRDLSPKDVELVKIIEGAARNIRHGAL